MGCKVLPRVSDGSRGTARCGWVILLSVYRLEGRVLERYRLVVWVSRVGEILRVELPGQLHLVNDQLSL
jgi:hypothetical protein